MKSRLFKDLDPSPKDRSLLSERVRALVALDDDVWRRLGEQMPNIWNAPSNQQQQVAQSAVRELRVGRQAASAVFSLTELICRAFVEDALQDNEEALVADLVALAGNDNAEPKLARFVRYVHEHLASVFREITFSQQSLLGTVPVLQSWQSAVELRANLGKGFESGTDPALYVPRVVGLFPIATIRINNDEDESILFQCDERLLADLITRLEVTLRELRAIAEVAKHA